MKYKKSSLVVAGAKYIYTIRPCRNDIKIMIYSEMDKTPIFTVYFAYVESWGFDVYRPKTIELLIRFYNENKVQQKEFRLRDYPLLFQSLLDCYFKDDSIWKRNDFMEKCRRYDNETDFSSGR